MSALPNFKDSVSLDPRDEYLALVAEKERRDSFRRWDLYTPYPKQAEWLNWDVPIKVLFGGNRIGKTYTAAYEMVCHLTGVYPVWWTGKRFFRPIKAWCVAVNYKQLREVMQVELLGDLKSTFGTGMIPKDLIVDKSMLQGVANAVDTIWVRHVPTGGVSILNCMVNEQGWEAFAGTARDVVWIDEECDHEVFTECRLRTMTGRGIMLITFTPQKGLTSLAKFLLHEKDMSVVRHIVIGWDDVPHLTENMKREMSVGLMPHEIEARRYGLPTQATGLIYPFLSRDLLVKPFELDWHSKGIIGLDVAPVGITAGALLRYDAASKITYLVNEHHLGRQPSAVHAAAMKMKFGCYPVRIDPSANRGEKDGERIVQEYRDAFGPDWEVKFAKNAVYSGISKLYNAMAMGQFKVFNTCRAWQAEWSDYVWDSKKVNQDGSPMPRKKDDHLMDATRYGYMDIGAARVVNGSKVFTHPLQTWEPLDPTTGF